MRLIDADRLIDDLSDLKRSPWANEPWASDQRKLGISEAIDMIQSIIRVDSQTGDAVQVVRCKDCVWWKDGYVCFKNDSMPWNENDFCSNGRRKPDETD